MRKINFEFVLQRLARGQDELTILLALSLSAAAATYRLVEQPARRIAFVRVPRVVSHRANGLANRQKPQLDLQS
jgi:peptidoglycan/LPS O-acetylase OafA/YrhL